MKYLFTICIIIVLITGCAAEDNTVSELKNEGLSWAETYTETLDTLKSQGVVWPYDMKVDMDRVKADIAISYADGEGELDDIKHEIVEQHYIYALLQKYATNNDIYNETGYKEFMSDMDSQITDIMLNLQAQESFPMVEGILAGLNMTLEQYVQEFILPTYEMQLFQLYVLEHMKNMNDEYVDQNSDELIEKLKEKYS